MYLTCFDTVAIACDRLDSRTDLTLVFYCEVINERACLFADISDSTEHLAVIVHSYEADMRQIDFGSAVRIIERLKVYLTSYKILGYHVVDVEHSLFDIALHLVIVGSIDSVAALLELFHSL